MEWKALINNKSGRMIGGKDDSIWVQNDSEESSLLEKTSLILWYEQNCPFIIKPKPILIFYCFGKGCGHFDSNDISSIFRGGLTECCEQEEIFSVQQVTVELHN